MGEGKKEVVLTAYHKDDAEETTLLKLLRGVHIANVVGMEVLRPAYEADNDDGGGGGEGEERVYFAKPMLGVRKSEIVEFMVEKGLEWREDESNGSDKYLRNRVRNEVSSRRGGADICVEAVEWRFGVDVVV